MHIVPLPVVTVIPLSQTIFVGSSPNFTCTVQFDDTVDIPLIVAIMFEPSPVHTDGRVHMESYTLYKRTFTLQASHSGQEYVCTSLGSAPTSKSSYILAQPTETSDDVTISISK